MEDKSKSLPIIGVVLFASALLWVSRTHSGLESLRPTSASSQTNAAGELEKNKVLARLWQDPLDALPPLTNEMGNELKITSVASEKTGELTFRLSAAYKNSESYTTSTSPGSLTNEIAQFHSSNNVAVLAVMLPGTPYAEDGEHRRRQRYALEVAVLSANFGPDDPSHIKFDQFMLIEQANNPRSFRFAYEWFSADANPTNQVLALWLNEDDFGHHPLERLNYLFASIDSPTKINFSFYLLDAGSDMLRAMVMEPKNATLTNLKDRFHILSTRATAADAALLFANWDARADPRRPEVNKVLSKCFDMTNAFHNWIATDEQLGKLIATEIGNRLNEPLQSSDRVVIVTEQDTIYGRSLQDAVTFALTNGCPTNALHASTTNVWELSYLRGLDGNKPPNGQRLGQIAQTQATPEMLLQTALEKKENQAAGDTQFDYAARLGDMLRLQDASLQRKNGRIVAVGLTGHDVYDKINLLQAMRKRLPGAVFFTTRLDARLWSSDVIKYTRGLLVASGYGLNPDFKLATDEFMPFRDSYQTAIYKATQAALINLTNKNSKLEITNDDLRGQLYVIGRNGPVRLPLEPPTKNRHSFLKPIVLGALGGLFVTLFLLFWFFPNFDPKRMQVSLGIVVVLGLLFWWIESNVGLASQEQMVFRVYGALLPATVLTVAIRCGFHLILKVFPKSGSKRLLFTEYDLIMMFPIGIGMVLGLLFYGAQLVANQANEEPWNFSAGISMWFCESIRILILLLSLLFLLFAFYLQRKNLKDIKKEIYADYDSKDANPDKLKSQTKEAKSSPDVPHSITDHETPEVFRIRMEERAAILWNEDQEQKIPKALLPEYKVDAEVTFKKYEKRAGFCKRLSRAFYCILGYFLILVPPLVQIGQIQKPLCIRGSYSHAIDGSLIGLAALAFLWVLFYVNDAIFLSARFLRDLKAGRTAWPWETLNHHAAMKGIQRRHLGCWLDVRVAAKKTQEMWKLILCAVVLLVLLVSARISYFDLWTWPLLLIGFFVAYFFIAAFFWWLTRSTAAKVREEAFKELDEDILRVKSSGQVTFWVPTPENTKTGLDKQAYLNRLTELRAEIENIKDGAFAPLFQDPASLAFLIPTGSGTILLAIFQYWFRQ